LGQVLHGSATTTEAIRRAIQHSQASRRALAKRHGINPKTVAKWKKRPSAEIDANVRFAASQPTRSSAGVAPELPNARMAHKGSTPAARWWPRERPESAPSRHWAGHRGWSALHPLRTSAIVTHTIMDGFASTGTERDRRARSVAPPSSAAYLHHRVVEAGPFG